MTDAQADELRAALARIEALLVRLVELEEKRKEKDGQKR